MRPVIVASRSGRAPAQSWWVLGPLSVAAGLALAASFAPGFFWPGTLVAVALLGLVTRQAPRLRTACGLGAVFGLALLLPSVSWQLLLTPEAYLGLVALEVPFYAALGGALHLTGRRRSAALWAAGAWTTIESAFSSWPFGGFGWLRLAHAHLDTPLAGLLPFVGVSGVTFVVALLGAMLGQVVVRRSTVHLGLAVAVTVLGLAAGAWGASWTPASSSRGSVQVGWVQGGASGGGLYGIGTPRSTSYRHADEVGRLMDAVSAGAVPRPDFIVAPENTTDMDPTLDAETKGLVEGMVRRAGVGVLMGVPLAGPGPDERRMSALWWTARGIEASYDKRNLVPMGEWIPFRDVFLPLVPALAYVGQQSIPGTEPGVLPVTLADGRPLRVGVGICYDVAFPGTFRDLVTHDADVIVVQSNNAMFASSAQIAQQFTITRARAAELRRPILVVTVSGLSGLIDAHGRVADVAPSEVSASGVAELALLDAVTPYAAGGWLVEPVIAVGTLAAWVALLGTAILGRMRNNGTSDPNPRGRSRELEHG